MVQDQVPHKKDPLLAKADECGPLLPLEGVSISAEIELADSEPH
jgi:hypothetical protein